MQRDHVERFATAVADRGNQVIDWLSEYLRFRSINPSMIGPRDVTQFRMCQEWLAESMSEWGVFDEVDMVGPEVDQPNIIVRQRGTGDGSTLMFNGHSDVVPVSKSQERAWGAGTPWSAYLDRGRLYGRGSCDMKGGNAAFLWAMKILADEGIRLRGDIIAGIVSGEETGNHVIGVDVMEKFFGDRVLVIVAEPTGLQICPASPGEVYFLIEVEGRSCHMASRSLAIYPQPFGVPIAGVDAIEKGTKIATSLREVEREWGVWRRHQLMPPGLMGINIAQLNGGRRGSYSAVADRCELIGSVLFTPGLQASAVIDDFHSIIGSIAELDGWLREHAPTVTIPYILDAKEAVDVPVDHPGCSSAQRAYQRMLKKEAVLGCTRGTNDGAYIFAKGQTVITWGPGSLENGAHGVDEWVDVEEVIDAVKVFGVAAMEWCGIED